MVTSAAWLSVWIQTLGFAPPPHGGFAISDEHIYFLIIHKSVSRLTGFHFHLPGRRSKIDVGDKLHIDLKISQTPPIYLAIGIIINNFWVNVNNNQFYHNCMNISEPFLIFPGYFIQLHLFQVQLPRTSRLFSAIIHETRL